MKNILNLFTFILSIFLLSLGNVNAENYVINDAGHYSLKEAYCTYHYPAINENITIKFTNDAITSISNLGTGGSIYEGTINYNTFFGKNGTSCTGKEFCCPSNLYIMYDVSASRHRGQAWFIDAGYNAEEGDAYHEAISLVDGGVTYLTSDGTNEPVNQYTVLCSLTKISSNSNGSTWQRLSANNLNYVQYENGSKFFVPANDTNNIIPINSGTLDCNSTASIYLKTSQTLTTKITSYQIVSSCNPNSDSYCVEYNLTKYANSNIDSGVANDGSNSNASSSETPNTITDAVEQKEFDFDTSKGCESYLGNPNDNITKPPAYYLQFSFNLIKYAAIILLFVLTIIDFAKAVAAHDNDALKKTLQKTLKRVIIVAIIFLLPILIEFLFKLLGIYSSDNCLNNIK